VTTSPPPASFTLPSFVFPESLAVTSFVLPSLVPPSSPVDPDDPHAKRAAL